MKTEEIKIQGINILLTSGGIMIGNALNQKVPISNEKLKALIPILAGSAGAIGLKNENLKSLALGTASYGILKLLRELLNTNATGVSGFKDHPTVRKVVDLLLPELGSLENEMAQTYEYQYEPAIIDIPHEEVNINTDLNSNNFDYYDHKTEQFLGVGL